ncbi:MAG: hypothetical protein J1F20_00840 [Muribaculaceae bacterium]|nr:hypothetical protein [Muribaculaceae bacterium]
MKNIFKTVALSSMASALLLITSCGSGHHGWSISGVIEGASDSTLYIEEPSGPAWIIIDSVKANQDGQFTYTALEPLHGANQAIYRLRLNDKAVYFPIEGADALSLTAANTDMDVNHKLAGSPAAQGFNTVDSLISDAITRVGAKAAINDNQLITQLGDVILNDTTCIVSYYTIKKPVEGTPIFTFDEPRKIGLAGAAATRYATLRPNDVRGQELAAMHFNAKKRLRGVDDNQAVAAQVAGRPVVEYVRTDDNGKEQNLDAVLDRGGVTVLSLTRYDHPLSAANTVALGEIYQKYEPKGLEIYQISFEPNEGHWRQTASTLPWITVYNRPTDAIDILVAYNADPINGNPISFVFDRNGELIARIDDPANLQKVIEGLY